ncbi:hypothetical protein HCN44_001330 [Aphidius gifuensis]|uniref:Uncharacterized protein n=1 Tax=Aphidius gifuensis TaxID=684658 RepID=A0A834XKX0_APHGI|nr:hypothetical protein HCN44_001330 [Aphidius gifuensis]
MIMDMGTSCQSLAITDKEKVLKVKSIVDSENSKSEIFFVVAGIGLRIVADSQTPNRIGRELAYASITESSAYRELDASKRLKPLTLELNAWKINIIIQQFK